MTWPPETTLSYQSVANTIYSHLSNKRGVHAYRFWKIPPSTKRNPSSTFIDLITKVSDVIAKTNDEFFSRSFFAIKLYSSSKMDMYYPRHIYWFCIFAPPPRFLERWEYILTQPDLFRLRPSCLVCLRSRAQNLHFLAYITQGPSINDVTRFPWLFDPTLPHATNFLLPWAIRLSSISAPPPSWNMKNVIYGRPYTQQLLQQAAEQLQNAFLLYTKPAARE